MHMVRISDKRRRALPTPRGEQEARVVGRAVALERLRGGFTPQQRKNRFSMGQASTLMTTALSTITLHGLAFGPSLLGAALVYFVGKILIGVLNKGLRKGVHRGRLPCS